MLGLAAGWLCQHLGRKDRYSAPPPLGTWKGKGGMVLLLSAAGEEGEEDLLGGFVLSSVR